MKMKIELYHWRHYFGGVAVLLLILQFLTGTFLALFYQPDLQQAYASVQNLYQDFAVGAWIRDSHRWLAFFIFAAIVAHVARSLLRKEFLNYARRSSWLTGGLLVLPILALLVTGLIALRYGRERSPQYTTRDHRGNSRLMAPCRNRPAPVTAMTT